MRRAGRRSPHDLVGVHMLDAGTETATVRTSETAGREKWRSTKCAYSGYWIGVESQSDREGSLLFFHDIASFLAGRHDCLDTPCPHP